VRTKSPAVSNASAASIQKRILTVLLMTVRPPDTATCLSSRMFPLRRLRQEQPPRILSLLLTGCSRMEGEMIATLAEAKRVKRALY
jgi:hypothetical protein